jgi:tRNA (guanine-N7-)-methyltransferase
MDKKTNSILDYHATSFTQGKMDFAWEELSEEERQQAYRDWEAGKGLIGGDPRFRPHADQLPDWALNRRFFRTLALDDQRGDNGKRLRADLAADRPLEIEIGFGRGDFILDRALRHPDRLFIGFEVKTRAARLCLGRAERLDIENLWISDDDCRFSMPRILPDGRVDTFHILFPDPWWKKQHRVKRLFSPPFVDLLAAKLRPGGVLHFKSDVKDYGELVRYLVEQHPAFGPHDPALVEQIGPYAPTHREFWCQEHGLPVWTYCFPRLEDGSQDGAAPPGDRK